MPPEAEAAAAAVDVEKAVPAEGAAVLPFRAVLRTSDRIDKLLLVLGVTGAACVGCVQPACVRLCLWRRPPPFSLVAGAP